MRRLRRIKILATLGPASSDSAMIRRVHREHVMALAGPRALLMQAAHPVAFAGFFAHTGALDDPYARLERTANVMNAGPKSSWGGQGRPAGELM